MQPDSHNFDLHEQSDAARPTMSRGIGVALLSALAAVLALIAIDVLVIGGAQAAPARPVVNVVKVSDAVPIQSTVYLSVTPGIKPGVDGKLHDAFSVTNFTVRAGQPVKLVINNTDTVDHSITAMGAGVNIVARPGLHTYTLIVHKQGKFQWMCMYPCDPYSMSHDGYMRGYITAI
jgi:plastocyanin